MLKIKTHNDTIINKDNTDMRQIGEETEEESR